jgi:hypothetical protein
MAKSAVLLLIVGLAFGLWLGFNPQAHAQTIKNWDQAKASYIQIKAKATTQIHQWDTKVSAVGKSSPKAEPASQSRPDTSAAWKQISTAFESLWNSIQRIWSNITAKIGKSS